MDSTKNDILVAAIRELGGNPGANMADIAKAAGVQRMTVHRYFGSRDQLINSIAIWAMEQVDEVMRANIRKRIPALKRLETIIAQLVPIADRVRFLYANLGIWDQPDLKARVVQIDLQLRSLVDQAKKEKSIAQWYPSAWITSAIDGLLYAAMEAHRAGNIATNDMAKLVVSTLFHGVGESHDE